MTPKRTKKKPSVEWLDSRGRVLARREAVLLLGETQETLLGIRNAGRRMLRNLTLRTRFPARDQEATLSHVVKVSFRRSTARAFTPSLLLGNLRPGEKAMFRVQWQVSPRCPEGPAPTVYVEET